MCGNVNNSYAGLKWYTLASIGACAGTFITSFALLSLCSFYVYNKDRFAPLPSNIIWYDHIVALIPACTIYIFASLYICWGLLLNYKIQVATSVLFLNGLCLVSQVYFATVIGKPGGEVIAGPIELLNITKEAIEAHESSRSKSTSDQPWLPHWLDMIQAKSTSCCGIVTYKDWEKLWPHRKGAVPSSCCQNPLNLTSLCPKDIRDIPYPKTAADFVKMDSGCYNEIVHWMSTIVLESLEFLLLVLGFFALGQICYSAQFFCFYVASRHEDWNLSCTSSNLCSDMMTGKKGGFSSSDRLKETGSPNEAFSTIQSSSPSLVNSVNGSVKRMKSLDAIGLDGDIDDKHNAICAASVSSAEISSSNECKSVRIPFGKFMHPIHFSNHLSSNIGQKNHHNFSPLKPHSTVPFTSTQRSPQPAINIANSGSDLDLEDHKPDHTNTQEASKKPLKNSPDIGNPEIKDSVISCTCEGHNSAKDPPTYCNTCHRPRAWKNVREVITSINTNPRERAISVAIKTSPRGPLDRVEDRIADEFGNAMKTVKITRQQKHTK